MTTGHVRPSWSGGTVRLTIRLLGTEVLHVSTDADDAGNDGPGDCTTYPVGFAPSHGDQRWTEHQLPEG